MDNRKTSTVYFVLGSLIALGWLMTSVTLLRTIGAF
jgi:hypothetical protein